MSGVIKSNQELLYGANIIAKPVTKGAKFAYTTSDEQGNYTLKLSSNSTYTITVSFIGFITLKDTTFVKGNSFLKDFLLKQDPNELEEVVINYRESVRITKDTTSYRVDAFVNGKERKLRQVLKKLPGVEVDRKGNVTVKGKKVTKVLVEDREFFTGDSKLAVNNIPAEVIEEIQVIEDYHESDLLKGLETSEEVALNINLKEDKKKFTFGSIEAGGGVKDRYFTHPTIFKYSKKVNLNFIGDINSTGDKSFTLKDYIDYEGGFDLNAISNIAKSPIVRLLHGGDFNRNNHYFGGFNLQLINAKSNWNIFGIALNDKTNSFTTMSQEYVVDEVFENRNTSEEKNQSMLLGKIGFESQPDENTRIKWENRIEAPSAKKKLNTLSVLNLRDLEYKENDHIDNISVKSNFRIERKFSKEHTSQAKVKLKFSRNTENQDWISSENIFSDNIPIRDNESIDIRKKSKLDTYQVNTLLKHFWVVNSTNHLYFSFVNKLNFDNYDSNLSQFQEGNLNYFEEFNNEILNRELFSSFITEYKRLIGEAFVTFKLEYLNYNRFNKQFGATNNLSHHLLLPSLKLDWDIDTNKEVSFYYEKRNDFPNYANLSVKKELRSFNSVYTGNGNLERQSTHNFKLQYRKFQTYGWSFYPSISYRLKDNKIQNIFIPNGIYSTSSTLNFETPEKELSTNFKTVYSYRYWRTSFRLNYSNKKYVSFLRGEETKSTSNSLRGSMSFRSFYVKGPNVDVTFSHYYNDDENIFFNSISDRTRLDFGLDYEIGDWAFRGEAFLKYYANRTTNTKNSFNEINSSIFYQQEDSNWAFEIKGNNLGGNKNTITSSFSDVIFNETFIAVFPRTILGKIIYKF